MKNDRPGDVADAMGELVRGYEEETQLYTRVRNLTWKQRMTLLDGQDLYQFGDLLDEKQDILRLIAEMETRLRGAKSIVLSRKPSQCPNRSKLEALLDGLAATIEQIRALESANASLLNAAIERQAAPMHELVQSRA